MLSLLELNMLLISKRQKWIIPSNYRIILIRVEMGNNIQPPANQGFLQLPTEHPLCCGLGV